MSTEVAVLGATGQVGRAVCQALRAQGHQVRAVVRRPQGVPDGTPAVVVPEWSTDALVSALSGCSALFAMVPLLPDAIALGQVTHEAAVRAGVDRVVRLSVLSGLIDDGTRLGALHGALDADLAARDVTHVCLRPDAFMQNLLAEVPALRSGVLTNATGDGLMGMIDIADIAGCAAAALTMPEPPASGVWDLTGGELLSFADVAQRYGRWAGHAVRYADITPQAHHDRLLNFGLPPFLAEVLAEVAEWTRNPARTPGLSDGVNRWLARPPRSLEQFFDAHAATLRPDAPA